MTFIEYAVVTADKSVRIRGDEGITFEIDDGALVFYNERVENKTIGGSGKKKIRAFNDWQEVELL